MPAQIDVDVEPVRLGVQGVCGLLDRLGALVDRLAGLVGSLVERLAGTVRGMLGIALAGKRKGQLRNCPPGWVGHR